MGPHRREGNETGARLSRHNGHGWCKRSRNSSGFESEIGKFANEIRKMFDAMASSYDRCMQLEYAIWYIENATKGSYQIHSCFSIFWKINKDFQNVFHSLWNKYIALNKIESVNSLRTAWYVVNFDLENWFWQKNFQKNFSRKKNLRTVVFSDQWHLKLIFPIRIGRFLKVFQILTKKWTKYYWFGAYNFVTSFCRGLQVFPWNNVL